MTAAGLPRRGRSELALRVLTAAAGIPVLLALTWLGGLAFVVAAAAVFGLAAAEICRAAGIRASDPLGWLSALGAGGCAAAAAHSGEAQAGALTATAMVTLALAVARAETEQGFPRWSTAIAAAAYPGLLGGYLVLLRRLPDGNGWVLLALFTTFAADTGAFFTGRTLRGPKLAPHVSPGKTVSGAAGGLLSGAVAAALLGALLDLEGGPVVHALLGTGAAVVSIAGDLGESLIKRSLGVKDMGHVFPGHGGLMDRLDSILFVAPVVYWVARWISA